MKIKDSVFTKVANAVCLVIIAVSVLFVIFRWGALPDRIPGHYNALGEVDRWGSRWELLLLPSVMVLLYAGISIVERHPKLWNTGVAVTKQNGARVYATIKNMLGCEKLILCLDFGYITVNSALARPLPSWFTIIFLILALAPVGYTLVRLARIK